MGRVVADKFLPLQKFAPSSPLSSTSRPHNPEDIIPNILPKPSVSKNRKEILSVADKQGLSVVLGSLFGINLARTNEERVQLESQSVKQYALSNPDDFFDLLMAEDLYAADVQKLLANTKRGHAYLVTGFLTTCGTLWTRTNGKSQTAGFSVTVPVAEIVGVPQSALVDPTVNPYRTAKTGLQRQMHVADEEIFAVSYSLVKIRYSFDKNAPHFTKRTPTVGPPVRANVHQLALGDDDDDEEEEQETTGAEDADVFIVDMEDDEDGEENAPSLELEICDT